MQWNHRVCVGDLVRAWQETQFQVLKGEEQSNAMSVTNISRLHIFMQCVQTTNMSILDLVLSTL